MDSTTLKSLKAKSREIVASLFDEALDESMEARLKEAKERVKSKMKQLAQAKLVVANIERELEDLRHELEHSL